MQTYSTYETFPTGETIGKMGYGTAFVGAPGSKMELHLHETLKSKLEGGLPEFQAMIRFNDAPVMTDVRWKLLSLTTGILTVVVSEQIVGIHLYLGGTDPGADRSAIDHLIQLVGFKNGRGNPDLHELANRPLMITVAKGDISHRDMADTFISMAMGGIFFQHCGVME